EFDTYFLLQLNRWILLETELDFTGEGVEVGQAQADFILSDCLTAVAGRFRVPIGFFNERLHPQWINRMPDFPLMFRQVSPADFSLNGVQLRGAKYLGCSPVKVEYAGYVANGLGLPPNPDLTTLANLNELKETSKDVNQAIAYGGRVGFWVPEWGLAAGSSTFFNTPYSPLSGPDMALWGFDVNYHEGNWDVRFECAFMRQGTGGLTSSPIRRPGLYAQVAYRPNDASAECVRNT